MKKIIFFFSIATSLSLESQLLELDYSSQDLRERFLKVKLFKQFLGGVNTLGHIDIWNSLSSTKSQPLPISLEGSPTAIESTLTIGTDRNLVEPV